MENLVRNLRENLPIITLLFYILCGSTIWIYYLSFNIDILNYCNLKDVIAFPLAAISIAVLIPIYFVGILLLFSQGLKSKVSVLIRKIVNNKFVGYVVLLLSTLMVVFIGFKAPHIMYYFILFLSIFLICKGSYEYFLRKDRVYYDFIISGFFLFLLFYISIRVDHIKNRDYLLLNSQNLSFIYKSEKIITSNERRWVGQTSEYLFLYDRISKSTEVYKMSEIDSLRFKVDN